MKHIRFSLPAIHAIGGFDVQSPGLVPEGVSFERATECAGVLGLTVDEVEGPLFSGSYDKGEMTTFDNVTLDELAALCGTETEKLRSRVAALPEDERVVWEALLAGTYDDIVESETCGSRVVGGSLHVSSAE